MNEECPQLLWIMELIKEAEAGVTSQQQAYDKIVDYVLKI